MRTTPFRTHWLACRSGLVVMVLTFGMLGCRPETEEAVVQDEIQLPTIETSTLKVVPRNWPTVVRCMGSFQADEQSTVGAKVGGRVATVHVELGDHVNAGDPLVTLDQQQASLLVVQAEAQLQQARAAIGLAPETSVERLDPDRSAPVREAKALWEESQAALARGERLLQKNAIAQSEYDEITAAERVTAARHQAALNGVRERIATVSLRQAELDAAKQQLDDTVVRAPFDGLVQQRSVAPGMYLSVGQMLAVIVRTDPLRFRGSVPERYAMSIRAGQLVRLHVEQLGEPILAKVSRITPALDQRSRALVFEADVENANGRMQTGLFAEAEVVIEPDAVALAVPESSIVEFAGTQKVWKVTDGVAGEQSVLVGPSSQGYRKVVEGLVTGDVVLSDGQVGRVAMIRSPMMIESDPKMLSAPTDATSVKEADSVADSDPADRLNRPALDGEANADPAIAPSPSANVAPMGSS
ncbi:MAG: efflux RND transporter periplasmic adaptor subunit [Planctomycetota bacterium]